MSEAKSVARRDLIIALALFVVGMVSAPMISPSSGFLGMIVFGTMIGGLVYGWKVLTFITPNIFLIMPIIGWVIFFFIKFVLSLLIAPFAFIIKTIANIIILCRKN